MIWLARIWQLRNYIILIIQFILPFLKKKQKVALVQYNLQETMDVIRFAVEFTIVCRDFDPKSFPGNILKMRSLVTAALPALEDINKVPSELKNITEQDLLVIKRTLQQEYPSLNVDWLDIVASALKVIKFLAALLSKMR
jgi:hypothetical protein